MLVTTAPRCFTAKFQVAKQAAEAPSPKKSKFATTRGSARPGVGKAPAKGTAGIMNRRPQAKMRLVAASVS